MCVHACLVSTVFAVENAEFRQHAALSKQRGAGHKLIMQIHTGGVGERVDQGTCMNIGDVLRRVMHLAPGTHEHTYQTKKEGYIPYVPSAN